MVKRSSSSSSSCPSSRLARDVASGSTSSRSSASASLEAGKSVSVWLRRAPRGTRKRRGQGVGGQGRRRPNPKILGREGVADLTRSDVQGMAFQASLGPDGSDLRAKVLVRIAEDGCRHPIGERIGCLIMDRNGFQGRCSCRRLHAARGAAVCWTLIHRDGPRRSVCRGILRRASSDVEPAASWLSALHTPRVRLPQRPRARSFGAMTQTYPCHRMMS